MPSRTTFVRAAGIAALLAISALQWPGTAALPLEVTYIVNEGFIIKSGDQKILIDGLLRRSLLEKYMGGGASTLVKAAATAEAPYDDIDLVLITHIHYDHFNAEVTRGYMKASKAPVVCPKEVAAHLIGAPDYANRVKGVTPPLNQSQRISAAGFDITAVRLRHMPFMVRDRKSGRQVDKHASVENLGFVLELGDRTIFHMGDAGFDFPDEYHKSAMPADGVDVLFAGPHLWSDVAVSKPIIEGVIRPKNIVAMHLAPNSTPKRSPEHRAAYRNLTIFKKPLEKRTY